MEDFGALILLGLLLVVFGLSLGSVIGWFKYRRYGAEVDYGAVGIGFLIAGAVALLALLPTDGPWIIGIAFLGVGAVYLARSRRSSVVDAHAHVGERGPDQESTHAEEHDGEDAEPARVPRRTRVAVRLRPAASGHDPQEAAFCSPFRPRRGMAGQRPASAGLGACSPRLRPWLGPPMKHPHCARADHSR